MHWLLFLIALFPTAALAQQSPFDCESSADHRQFDFWLGKWEVRDSNNTLQGHNHVLATQNGCAVEENWRSIRGGTGQSLNYFSPASGQWRQLWIDAGASIIDISGGIVDGSMVLEGSIYYLNRQVTIPFRGTWTLLPDGRVRQFFQEKDAQGKWQTWFEGFYSKATSR
ncbi:MAG: hypothetical protein ABJN62_04955 [Halioglobus sp.]